MYIYIYRERERQRIKNLLPKEKEITKMSIIFSYIYIYVYIGYSEEWILLPLQLHHCNPPRTAKMPAGLRRFLFCSDFIIISYSRPTNKLPAFFFAKKKINWNFF